MCVVGHQPGAVRRAHWLHSHGQDCRVPSCYRYQDGPRRGDSEGGVKLYTPTILSILLFIRLAWFSPSARTSINPFSPDWRQKAFQLLKNQHSCHRQNTLKWNKDIFWGFRVILNQHLVSLNCEYVQELREVSVKTYQTLIELSCLQLCLFLHLASSQEGTNTDLHSHN